MVNLQRAPPAAVVVVPPSVFVPFATSIVPVALLVSVLPPWIVPLFNCKLDAPVSVTAPPFTVVANSCTVLPLAVIVPPALFTVIPISPNIDPAVASTVPVFVIPPWAGIVSPALWFELIVPEFTSVIWPSPMLPAPDIVSWLVSVFAPCAAPWMKLLTLFDSVTVPCRSRLAFPCSCNSVPFPVEFSCTVPNCE